MLSVPKGIRGLCVAGLSPGIFRLFSGTETVAARRRRRPMEAAWCGMP